MHRDGIDLHVVASGGEIIESAATLKPNIIVLKDILPGMNGHLIVPLLRTMPSTKKIPIVLYDDTLTLGDEIRYGRKIPEGVACYLSTSDASAILDAIKTYAK